MKKYFSSGFFLNLKSIFLAIQCNQPELLGVSGQEMACQTVTRALQISVKTGLRWVWGGSGVGPGQMWMDSGPNFEKMKWFGAARMKARPLDASKLFLQACLL